jgi:hypothetical protein
MRRKINALVAISVLASLCSSAFSGGIAIDERCASSYDEKQSVPDISDCQAIVTSPSGRGRPLRAGRGQLSLTVPSSHALFGRLPLPGDRAAFESFACKGLPPHPDPNPLPQTVADRTLARNQQLLWQQFGGEGTELHDLSEAEMTALVGCGRTKRSRETDESDQARDDAVRSLLVEVEGFAECGGWVVDQQFIDVMGSSYLLAHGLGKPCQNASTIVDFPAEGNYRVWVRTKDWVPESEWAPGQFRVLVNGEPLDELFGTKGDGKWLWQDGGFVEIRAGQARIELQDLTGFDGRCDAIFFTTDANTKPPQQADEAMRCWRQELLGLQQPPKSAGKFEVVGVGGGLAGCSAAITASRQGCKVALIQNRPVFGGNNSSEIGVHTGQWGIAGRLIMPEIKGNYGYEIKDPNLWLAAEEAEARRQAVIDAEDSITQFLGWHVFHAQKEGDRIESVDAMNIYSNEQLRFHAPVFIDCTGDGWVGYYAGADFRYGQESRDQHDESLAPLEGSKMTLGSSLQWYAQPTDEAVDFPDVPWATTISKGHNARHGGWRFEYGHFRDTLWEAEEIRDYMIRAALGAFVTEKKRDPATHLVLRRLNYIIGKRESRRLMGDHIMTQADCWDDTAKPDKVAQGGNPFDLHVPSEEHDFLVAVDSHVSLKERRLYDIPLRCLYSRNVRNLFMAGRCISATRIAHSSMRIQNTGGQNGVAVGAAASLCVKYGATPREVGQKHLRELQGIVFAKGVNTEAAKNWRQLQAEKRKTSASNAGEERLQFPTQIDTDGDGLISSAEWIKGKPEWGWLVPIIDTNKDGQIDPKEYEAFQEYKARNPDWRTRQPQEHE